MFKKIDVVLTDHCQIWLLPLTSHPSRHGPDFHRPQSKVTIFRQSGLSPTTVPKMSTGMLFEAKIEVFRFWSK